MGELMDKIVVTNVHFLPAPSRYKPVVIKNSPREYDEQQQKRKKKGWLPKRVRQHPKMRRIFGKAKRRQKKARKQPKPMKTKGEGFNKIVEKAYTAGKL